MKIFSSIRERLSATIYRKLALIVFISVCVLGITGICLVAVYRLLSNRDVYEIMAWLMLVKVCLLVIIGVALHRMLTARLFRLMQALNAYRLSGFHAALVLPANVLRQPGDELDRLGRTIHDMAQRLTDQLLQFSRWQEERRELMANVSHDIRAPLASMRAYLETMSALDSADQAEQRRYLEVALRHADRVTRLVEDLFELTKFEAKQVQPQKEAFLVGDLLQDIAQKYAVRARDRSIRLRAEAPRQQPLVFADISLIERVLVNLVDNALRYTKSGGEVVLSLETERDAVRVSIRDTGVGIPADEVPRIFQRFYQSDRNRSFYSGGTGLGLSIVKNILDLHNEQIEVESQVDVGTTVRFSLSRANAPR